MTNREKMEKERQILTKNLSFKQINQRLGNFDKKNEIAENIDGISEMSKRLEFHGGYFQQNRMIRNKQQTLQKALLYSYQSAFVQKCYQENEKIHKAQKVRALINPNKLKENYDDKIISIGFENEYTTGDIFEWTDTNTYWLIYLQQKTEVAYFRGNIRRCRFEILWKDGNQIKKTYAAVEGPGQTAIDSGIKHSTILDEPNYQLSLLLPLNKDTIKQFKRYSKFYLKGLESAEPVCWRVEAVDSISMPNILVVKAQEYYINKDQDDVDNGLVDGLIEEIKPDDSTTIVGENLIKPKTVYKYRYNGIEEGEWKIEGEYLPIQKKILDGNVLEISWNSFYTGKFKIIYGIYEKNITVESLF